MSDEMDYALRQSTSMALLRRVPRAAALPSIWCASALVMLILLTPSWGGYELSALFGWHPLLMAASFLALMPSGAVVYAVDALPCVPGDRSTRRSLHAALQLAAGVAAATGYAAAYVAHEVKGHAHIPLSSKSSVKLVHVVTGLLALAAVLYQVGTGLLKLRNAPVRTYKSHGAVGPFLWALALPPLISAAFFQFWAKERPLAAFLLVTAVGAVVLSVVRILHDPQQSVAGNTGTTTDASPPSRQERRFTAADNDDLTSASGGL